MALDLDFTIDNKLIVYKETNTKKIFIKYDEGEVNNIFYYIIKHKTEILLNIKDENLKARILETILSTAKTQSIDNVTTPVTPET